MDMDMAKAKDVADDGRNQHGFPQGYHFVPEDIEIVNYLEERLAGNPLPYPLPNIFHDARIRNFNPDELYEKFKGHEEAGSIYLFDRREFRTPEGSKVKPVRAAKGRSKLRPVRGTNEGWWKASGGGKAVKRGGAVVGYKLTLVFYKYVHVDVKRRDESYKTEWCLKEYTSGIIGPDNKVSDLALYRLYKMEKGLAEKNAGRDDATSSKKGTRKVKELPSSGPPSMEIAASTSEAQAEASAGQTHHHHDNAFGVPSSAPPPANYSPTSPLHKAVTYPELANWDNMLPTSQQQAAEHLGYPETAEPNEQLLKLLPPTPLPTPAAEGYIADEFTVWCQTNQQQQQQEPEAANPLFPMPDEDLMLTDLPILTESDADELYSCTLDELFASPDHVNGEQRKANTDEQV